MKHRVDPDAAARYKATGAIVQPLFTGEVVHIAAHKSLDYLSFLARSRAAKGLDHIGLGALALKRILREQPLTGVIDFSVFQLDVALVEIVHLHV